MLCVLIRGDSYEYTQYPVFNNKKKKKITPNYPKSAAKGFFSQGLKNEFETAVVNEPSAFEPLKFYCITKKAYIINMVEMSNADELMDVSFLFFLLISYLSVGL